MTGSVIECDLCSAVFRTPHEHPILAVEACEAAGWTWSVGTYPERVPHSGLVHARNLVRCPKCQPAEGNMSS